MAKLSAEMRRNTVRLSVASLFVSVGMYGLGYSMLLYMAYRPGVDIGLGVFAVPLLVIGGFCAQVIAVVCSLVLVRSRRDNGKKQ